MHREQRAGPASAGVRWLFGVLLIVSAAVTLYAARGATFSADEWAYLLGSVHSTPGTVLDPVVGHLTALLILTYHALYATVGLSHSWPYRTVSTATHLLCCILLFVYARRRVGDIGGLLATAPILFLGTGADTFITLHQAAPVGSLTAGLAALLALDRRQGRWDVFACAMLVLATAGDAEGVILSVAIVLELLRTPGRRTRLWVPLVPVGLFTAWTLHYHPVHSQGGLASTSSLSALLHRARYVFDTAAGAVAGLVGLQLSSPTLHRNFPAARFIGHVLVIVVTVAGVWCAWRRKVTPRLVTFLVTLLGYWVVLALARGSAPSGYDNRYVFVGALMLVLVAVELLQGVRLRRRPARILVLVVVACTALNVVWIFVDGRFKRREGAIVRAELGALEISRGVVAADFAPDTNIRLVAVRAGGYFAAITKYGSSPADSPAALGAAPEDARLAADSVLVRALGVMIISVPGARAARGGLPAIESIQRGVARPSGACLELQPGAPLSVFDIRLPPGGSYIQTSKKGVVVVFVRRFGAFPSQPLGMVSGGLAWLRAPLGRATAPWHARLVTTRPTTVCR